MKYAVPVTGGALSSHFGHCEQFAVFDVNDSSKEITSETYLTPPPHEPGVFPQWLAGEGVEVVIAGGMGSRAVQLFAQNNIQVVTGAQASDPKQAVVDYLNGELATGGYTCDH